MNRPITFDPRALRRPTRAMMAEAICNANARDDWRLIARLAAGLFVLIFVVVL